MNTESNHLQVEQFQQFFDARLPADQQAALEDHLERCGDCREQLQTAAAEMMWWEDANDFLADDDFEPISEARNAATQTLNQEDAGAPSITCEDDESLPTDIRQIIAWLDATDDPIMLGRLGSYEIAGVVGAGGMGVVLKGFDRSLNRYVAIKILAPHLATSGAARKRFSREAQAAAAVVHNNVIAIHGVDETNSLPYLVMPYLRGTSLQRRIEQNGALSIREVLRLAMQTARGLAAAHDQGLVHRDVKPANILLDGTTERVLLTDFGLARAADDASLTQSGVIAGTPFFMSPEQAEGAAIDHRSDLFSLGSVLYAMCTGRPPFRAETSWGILRKVTDAAPHPIRDLNPEIPEWMCELVSKLHQKNPDLRFQTADEIASLLERCLAHIHQPREFALPTELAPRHEPSPTLLRSPARGLFAFGLIAATVCGAAWLHGQSNGWFFLANDLEQPTLISNPDAAADNDNSSIDRSTAPSVDVPDWDDSLEELARIRAAVERLDKQTLQVTPQH